MSCHDLIRDKNALTAAFSLACLEIRSRKLRIKVGFHMIVPIAPVVLKYFETIQTTGEIGSFHMIVSIASKARDADTSAMSLRQTIEFLCVFCQQATLRDDFYS